MKSTTNQVTWDIFLREQEHSNEKNDDVNNNISVHLVGMNKSLLLTNKLLEEKIKTVESSHYELEQENEHMEKTSRSKISLMVNLSEMLKLKSTLVSMRQKKIEILQNTSKTQQKQIYTYGIFSVASLMSMNFYFVSLALIVGLTIQLGFNWTASRKEQRDLRAVETMIQTTEKVLQDIQQGQDFLYELIHS